MNANFAKSPHITEQEAKADRYLTLPVVYLNNIFQAHHVSVQIPQTHPITRVEANEPTTEELAALRKYNLRVIEPSTQRVEMPAFLKHDQIQMLSLAEKTKDDRTRLLYLYAAVETSPQLFPALNQLLPANYHFSPFEDFLENPIVTFRGRQKALQLSPIYLRERPEHIIKLISDPFSTAQLSQFYLARKQADVAQTAVSASSSTQSAPQTSTNSADKCKLVIYDGLSDDCHCYMFSPPRSDREVVNISILGEDDERQYRQVLKSYGETPSKSVYFEQKRVEIGKLFVSQARERYDASLLQKFHEIMSANTEKQISADTLELAVTMLFFDKLELINYFTIMEKCSELSETKNKQFGWPTIYPPADTLQAIKNMIERVDEIQQIACKQIKIPVLNDIYEGYYLPAKRGYEQQMCRFSSIKISRQDVRICVEQNVKMCEIRVQAQPPVTVRVPFVLYEAGIDADNNSEAYKALYSCILEEISAKSKNRKSKKESKDEGARGGVSAACNEAEETDAATSATTRMQNAREFPCVQPRLAQKTDFQFIILQYIKAGKLNVMTIFDLDDFCDLCLRVCASDCVGYPLFQYCDFVRSAGFGSQPAVFRAGASLYAVLLRYVFGEAFSERSEQAVSGSGGGRNGGNSRGVNKQSNGTQSNKTERKDDAQSLHRALVDLGAIEALENFEQAENSPGMPKISQELLQLIVGQQMDVTTFIARAVDQLPQFYVHGGASAAACTAQCNHNSRGLNVGIDVLNNIANTEENGCVEHDLCPAIYNHEKREVRSGFALLSSKIIFDDVEDLRAYCDTLSGEKRTSIELNRFYSPKTMQYACQILQATDMVFNMLPSVIADSEWLNFRVLFGSYLSARGVDITYFKERALNKFSEIQMILDRANAPPPAVEQKHLDMLKEDYDEENIYAELFRACMQDLDYRITPSYYLGSSPLSSLLNPNAISLTYQPLLYSNMLSPEDIKDIQQHEVVDKELFVYPLSMDEISPDYEPEVDPSVLKKETIILKLKTITQSYKIMPEEMYPIHEREHLEQFDLGVYEYDRFHCPSSFNETRQLANSVLNRGKYFTIPFGSEAQHVANDIILDNDIEDTSYAESRRSRFNSAAIKSQYLTFSQPTGAEARVCHIEEEELCFGLFSVRTAEVLKILIEWMAIYATNLLKYFSVAITATVAKAPVDVSHYYEYRQIVDEEEGKMSSFFYEGQYKYYCDDDGETEDDSDDSDSVFLNPFSAEFDQELRENALRYQKFADQCVSDEMLARAGATELKDIWVEKGCYAPIQPWLLENQDHILATPPPPRMPALLQLHLTQIYTTGQIILEITRNPLIAIPIIARTLQHMLAEAELAEERAATSWRLLYPESYYKSIDHATTTLIEFDKKYTNPKIFEQDLVRRLKDAEAGVNPNALDACPDISLPRIYDYVHFNKYLQMEKAHLTPQIALQYENRLHFYQNFIPESEIRMFFKFSTVDQLSEVMRICSELGISRQAQAVSIKLTEELSNGSMEQFDVSTADSAREDLTRMITISNKIERVLNSYSEANISLLLPSDELTFLVNQIFEQEQSETNGIDLEDLYDERKTCEPEKMVFIEDVVADLNKTSVNISDTSCELYSDEAVKDIISNLKQLTYEQSDTEMRIRQQFEKLVEQNAYIPSLFDNEREIRDTSEFYTKYRHMSLPTCSLRSVFLIRSVLFQEPIEDGLFDRLMQGTINYDEMAEYFLIRNETFKSDMYTKLEETPQPKEFAQENMPAFEQELGKKMLLDDIFIPLLIKHEGPFIRYMDQEILATLRLLFIIATRVEFSLKVLDLPAHLRNAAVYGTRSTHPLPYNFTQALNFGSSFFGYDIKQHLEEESRCPKQLLDTVYAQCSQKIFYGHQPYINLMNTSDTSVCGCRCQQLKCTFCGGIGAGYNGTLSGSINNKYTTPVEQAHSLCNGIIRPPIQEVFDWDDIVDVEHLQYTDVDGQISLMYKMPVIIPRYKYENYNYQVEEESKQSRRPRRGSKSESSEEEEDSEAFVEKKLASIHEKPDIKHSEYFVTFYGSRLSDTAFMIPPAPHYVFSSQSVIRDKFFNAWMNLSYRGLEIERTGECPLSCSIIDHLQTDEQLLAIDDPVLSSFFQEIPQLEEFHFRNIIKASRSEPSFREFYHLFSQVQEEKDDELTSECEAVLGIYAYPFLTVKRHMGIVSKRIETLSYKMIAHHIDIPSFEIFKSSKSTSANSLTVAFALFALWQQRLSGSAKQCMPWLFCEEIVKYFSESDEEIYICEGSHGFLNIQALLVENSGK